MPRKKKEKIDFTQVTPRLITLSDEEIEDKNIELELNLDGIKKSKKTKTKKIKPTEEETITHSNLSPPFETTPNSIEEDPTELIDEGGDLDLYFHPSASKKPDLSFHLSLSQESQKSQDSEPSSLSQGTDGENYEYGDENLEVQALLETLGSKSNKKKKRKREKKNHTEREDPKERLFDDDELNIRREIERDREEVERRKGMERGRGAQKRKMKEVITLSSSEDELETKKTKYYPQSKVQSASIQDDDDLLIEKITSAEPNQYSSNSLFAPSTYFNPSIYSDPSIQQSFEAIRVNKLARQKLREMSKQTTTTTTTTPTNNLLHPYVIHSNPYSSTSSTTTTSSSSFPQPETIIIRVDDGAKQHLKFRVNPNEPLVKLWTATCKLLGILNEESLVLKFDGIPLKPNSIPYDFDIHDNDILKASLVNQKLEEVQLDVLNAIPIGDEYNKAKQSDKNINSSVSQNPVEDLSDEQRVMLIVREPSGQTTKYRIRMEDPILKIHENYCEKMNKNKEKVIFTFDGEKLNLSQTPSSYDMEDEDLIDVSFV